LLLLSLALLGSPQFAYLSRIPGLRKELGRELELTWALPHAAESRDYNCLRRK
jgi:hypothetical protein